MPHHGNEEEHTSTGHDRAGQQGDSHEPVIRDNRKVDPVTGQARHPEGGTSSHGAGPASGTDSDGDALAQAEEILNGVEVPAEESVAQGAAGTGSANAEAAELRNDLLRLQAEYVNYRNRVERERAADKVATTASVLSTLLPALDDLDRAEQHGDLEGSPLAIVAQKLRGAIGGLGLEAVGVVGEPFDTAVHEAIAQLPNPEATEMTVADVVQRGYRIGERLVRPAKVAVFVPASGE